MRGLRRNTGRPKSEAVRDDRGNVVDVDVRCRMFTLVRELDVSGVSGTGVVAEGIEFSSGVVALTWLSDWPTSVVFHDRGIESVEAVHGHGGATRIVWA